MTKRSFPICAACFVSGLALTSPAAAWDASVERGRSFARTNCAGCHAVDRVGTSPLREAPVFRELHTRYDVEDLGEAFAEGITTGHPGMPEFKLDTVQITDLLAFLKSLER